jgi:hypothetical protein
VILDVATLLSATVALSSPVTPHTPVLVTSKGIIAARAYARRREGTVAFAVLDQHGRLRGLNRTVRFPSASVVKAMLLVARLREIGGTPLSAADRALLEPMITQSDNNAARAMHALVGDAGLWRVARAARMRYFATSGTLFNTQLTAADQARFFFQIDALVPAAHRRFARRVLSGITSSQRWGIAPVAHDRGLKIFFKGGWRTAIVHQVALLEKGSRRIALAILTSGESMAYGEQTLAGIARRVLS